MSSFNREIHKRQTVQMMILSVVAWFAFALFYRVFWPGASSPGENLALFWVWFVVGSAAFVAVLFLCYRLFKTPPAQRSTAVVALSAPALCCDVFTVTFFETWFPNGGGADDRIYAAMILGGIGIFQFVGLFLTDPEDTAPSTSQA